MSALALALAEIERKHATAIHPSVTDAAKVVVALSGWQRGPDGNRYVTSAIAIAVLKAAIEREENPTLRLAPPGVEPGVL